MDAPSRCVMRPARAVLSSCQGVQLPEPLPQDKESWRPGACPRPILAGTPVRRRGVLGAHIPGHRHGSDPGALGRWAATCPGRSYSQIRWLRSEGGSPHGLVGRSILSPVRLLGFPLYESGPLGIPGLHPVTLRFKL